MDYFTLRTAIHWFAVTLLLTGCNEGFKSATRGDDKSIPSFSEGDDNSEGELSFASSLSDSADDPVSLDLGSVDVGSSENYIVLISNIGKGTSRNIVPSVSGEGFALGATSCGDTLGPNETCSINVIFSPQSVASYEGRLVIESRGNRLELILLGEGTEPGGDPTTTTTTTSTTSTTSTTTTTTTSTTLPPVGDGTIDLLESVRWDTATGSSVNAWTDGGIGTNFWCDPSTVSPMVFAGSTEGWGGEGNVLSFQNTTGGCGGFLLDRVFPQPGAGVKWTFRYAFKQDSLQIHTHHHGLGDLNPVGSIDVVFHRVQHAGSPAGTWIHSVGATPADYGWTMLDNTNGERGLYTNGGWERNRRLSPNEWYQFSFVLEWVTTTTYRIYPEVRDMDGNLIADYRYYIADYINGNGTPRTLEDYYNSGGVLYRRSTGDSTAESVRNFYFGIAQSKSTNTGRVYYSNLDVGSCAGPTSDCHFDPISLSQNPPSNPPSETPSLGFNNLERLASSFAQVDLQDYTAQDVGTWDEFPGDIDGFRTPSPPIEIINGPTPTGDGSYGRFSLVGLQDRWTPRYHRKSFSSSNELAVGCVWRWNIPSNDPNSISWGKGPGFFTSSNQWAGYMPPGLPPRSPEANASHGVFNTRLNGTDWVPNRNGMASQSTPHGEWHSWEMYANQATGELRMWWNGVLATEVNTGGGPAFIEVKVPMITLGGGSGLGTLTVNDYIDVDACVVYHN